MLTCLISDLQHSPQLRFVRIWMSAPTFDRITIDSRVKLVDYISAIGGTMGLFLGFSVLSAVEIVYYLAKYVTKLFTCNQERSMFELGTKT